MNPLLIELPLSEKDLQRFYSKIKINEKTGCWEWQASLDKNGYGIFEFKYKRWKAHRFSLFSHGIKLIEGFEVDHLCRNSKCVNPEHLEQVIHQQNVLRGISFPAVNFQKTHCKNGHEFNEKNTYIHPTNGERHCRICIKMSQRKRRSNLLNNKLFRDKN